MNENITEEEREKFNAAQVGWGRRKAVEIRNVKVLGEMTPTPLIIPKSFITIGGVEFEISSESLEIIITEAIKLKLDVYNKGENSLIKCPAALYELNDKK